MSIQLPELEKHTRFWIITFLLLAVVVLLAALVVAQFGLLYQSPPVYDFETEARFENPAGDHEARQKRIRDGWEWVSEDRHSRTWKRQRQ